MMQATIIEAIRQTVGAAPAEIKAQGLTRFATSSRPSNRDGWARVMPDGIVRFGCWRQGVSGWWRDGAADRHASQRDDRPDLAALAEQEKQRQRHERINRAIFKAGQPLQRHEPVGQYLVNRGLDKLSKCPQALRMSALTYFNAGREVGRFPAMLAAVTDPQGVMVAVHRTYIDFNGQKAPVPQPRKLSRTSGLLAGASIKLFAPANIDGKLALGVAEGIETALACYLASGIPTWSCMNAGGVRAFDWPQGLQTLVVFADNDANGVGQSAARDLAGRAAAAGMEVRVLIPETVGTDWLDVYVGGFAA